MISACEVAREPAHDALMQHEEGGDHGRYEGPAEGTHHDKEDRHHQRDAEGPQLAFDQEMGQEVDRKDVQDPERKNRSGGSAPSCSSGSNKSATNQIPKIQIRSNARVVRSASAWITRSLRRSGLRPMPRSVS